MARPSSNSCSHFKRFNNTPLQTGVCKGVDVGRKSDENIKMKMTKLKSSIKINLKETIIYESERL